MENLLRFLADNYKLFLGENRYRIVSSEVARMSSGHIDLESDKLRVRILCDRSPDVFLDVQGPGMKPKEWYSLDLLHTLVTGEIRDVSRLDEHNISFLEEHLDTIEARLSDPEQRDSTIKELKQLARARAKRLFG